MFHPGEAQALEEVRREHSARQALYAQAREVFRQQLSTPRRRTRQVAENPKIDSPKKSISGNLFSSLDESKTMPPPAHQLGKVEAACVFCGQLTSDWWYLDRKSGRCKCRECLTQGIA